MKSQNLKKFLFLGGLSCLALSARAQLLRGVMTSGEIKEITVVYSPDGNSISDQYQTIPLKDGAFTFDIPLTEPFTDVTLQVGNAIAGAHLEKGKTVDIRITPLPDGTLSCTYGGAGPEVNRFYNRFVRAFDMMRYFSFDPEQAKTYEEYMALLKNETDSVRALLPSIADTSLRSYYTRMTDASNRWLQIRLLMDKAEAEKADVNTYPAYRALIDSIDVNDEINMRCNLSLAWLSAQMKQPMNMEDMGPYCYELMGLIDKYVTNPKVRREMARNVGYMYFTYGNGTGDFEKFWADYKQFVKEDTEILTAYEPKMEAYRKTRKGAKAFDTTMTSPDGKVCRLSDFFGKFTYVDVWATWCGPCCAEIPYLEKLVEHFKDNDNVQFISISIDTNQKAWHKKLDADKPAWKQFILSKDEAAAFTKAWGITGIPRFIMIDKAGNIFSADAQRPSDEQTAHILEEQSRR